MKTKANNEQIIFNIVIMIAGYENWIDLKEKPHRAFSNPGNIPIKKKVKWSECFVCSTLNPSHRKHLITLQIIIRVHRHLFSTINRLCPCFEFTYRSSNELEEEEKNNSMTTSFLYFKSRLILSNKNNKLTILFAAIIVIGICQLFHKNLRINCLSD